jgi:hypothetical protein
MDEPQSDASQKETFNAQTISGAAPADAGPVEEPAKLGPLQRLTGVIFSPGDTFKDVNRKPTWMAPLLIAMLFSGAFFVFHAVTVKPDWVTLLREQQRRNQQQGFGGNRQMPEEQMPMIATVTKYFTFGVFLLVPIVHTLVVSGALALGLLLIQAQASFKKVLSVVAWSSVGTGLIHYVVLAASMFVKGFSTLTTIFPQELDRKISATNVGAFMSAETSPALRALGDSIDVFSFWFMLLLCLGLAAVSGSKKITPGKVAVVVIGLQLLYMVIKVGLARFIGFSN